MAINITANNNSDKVKVKLVAADTTKVKRVVIGRPVRRVNSSTGTLRNLDDVDDTNITDGSVLVYSTASTKFETTLILEKQTVNGGQY